MAGDQMNVFERRAIGRVRKRFDLPKDELVLEFDVGKPLLSILPGGLQLGPTAQRIDLICTTAGLYVHVEGRVVRIPWADILEIRRVDLPIGTFIAGTQTSGEPFQVFVGPHPRAVDRVAAERIAIHENSLPDNQRAARREQLAAFKAKEERDMQRHRTQQRLREQTVKATGYAAARDGSAGQIGGGDVSFMGNGLWIHAGRELAVIVPYQTLGPFQHQTANNGTDILVAECDAADISHVIVQPEHSERWLDLYRQWAAS